MWIHANRSGVDDDSGAFIIVLKVTVGWVIMTRNMNDIRCTKVFEGHMNRFRGRAIAEDEALFAVHRNIGIS